jgi:hypothetical protein
MHISMRHLGTCTGLVPGFQVNSVAFLFVGVASTLPSSLVAVEAAVPSNGIVYTFSSVVPGLLLMSLKHHLHPVFSLDVDSY